MKNLIKRAWNSPIAMKLFPPKGTASVSIVVTRADGTVEDLGVVSVSRAPRWKAKGK